MTFKMYLTVVGLIMISCLLAVVISILLMPKNGIDEKKCIQAGRIAMTFYCMTGGLAIIVGVPYFIMRLFM